MAEKKEVEKVTHLKNNTKGLRHVAGVKVMPSAEVELSPEQLEAVKSNTVAMAWIEAGDLSLT